MADSMGYLVQDHEACFWQAPGADLAGPSADSVHFLLKLQGTHTSLSKMTTLECWESRPPPPPQAACPVHLHAEGSWTLLASCGQCVLASVIILLVDEDSDSQRGGALFGDHRVRESQS